MDHHHHQDHRQLRTPSCNSLVPEVSSEPNNDHQRHDDQDELIQHMPLFPPQTSTKSHRCRKRLSKQLSLCETPRDMAWEKRRQQILKQERKKNGITEDDNITDEDLNELKGCIELGFGFNEEDGQRLCNTLPALDIYFAVTRQLSTSPVTSPHSTRASSASLGDSRGSSTSLGERSSSFGSPKSDSESWKICSPGDNPKQVKTKLRHWAQAVACSMKQSY